EWAGEAPVNILWLWWGKRGSLKFPFFRQVVALLPRGQEAFRTPFAMTGAGLAQRTAPWQPPHLLEIDLRRLPKEQREGEARRLSAEGGGPPFYPERGAPPGASLGKPDHDDHLLALKNPPYVREQQSCGDLVPAI